jgi:single-stranded DNA-specific DHH superfamily exonuclease
LTIASAAEYLNDERVRELADAIKAIPNKHIHGDGDGDGGDGGDFIVDSIRQAIGITLDLRLIEHLLENYTCDADRFMIIIYKTIMDRKWDKLRLLDSRGGYIDYLLQDMEGLHMHNNLNVIRERLEEFTPSYAKSANKV